MSTQVERLEALLQRVQRNRQAPRVAQARAAAAPAPEPAPERTAPAAATKAPEPQRAEVTSPTMDAAVRGAAAIHSERPSPAVERRASAPPRESAPKAATPAPAQPSVPSEPQVVKGRAAAEAASPIAKAISQAPIGPDPGFLALVRRTLSLRLR